MSQIYLFLIPFGIAVLIVVIFFTIFKIIERKKGNELRRWTKENNLNYIENISNSLFTERKIQNLIWGEYKGKRIFIFKLTGIEKAKILAALELFKYTNSMDRTIVGYLFVNGYFHKPMVGYHIDPKRISSLIKDNSSEKIKQDGVSEFGNNTIWEHIIITIAHIFYEKGVEINYREAKKIIFSAMKFFRKKKKGFLNFIYPILMFGTNFQLINEIINSQEVIDFVQIDNPNINKDDIINVLNKYQKLRMEWKSSGKLANV